MGSSYDMGRKPAWPRSTASCIRSVSAANSVPTRIGLACTFTLTCVELRLSMPIIMMLEKIAVATESTERASSAEPHPFCSKKNSAR